MALQQVIIDFFTWFICQIVFWIGVAFMFDKYLFVKMYKKFDKWLSGLTKSTVGMIYLCFLPITVMFLWSGINLEKNIDGDLLGYFGSILGGFMTLIGVWITIHYQEKQRREDLAIEYKPLFTVNIDLNDIKLNNNYLYINNIEVKSVGRGEMYNFVYDLLIYSDGKFKKTNSNINEKEVFVNGETNIFKIDAKLIDEQIKDLQENGIVTLRIKHVIKGKDLTGNEIIQEIEKFHSVRKEGEGYYLTNPSLTELRIQSIIHSSSFVSLSTVPVDKIKEES